MDACVYNTRIMGAAHVQNVVELACRTALAYRGVSHITMPVDLQSQPASKDPRSERNVPDHVSDLMAHSRRMPSEDHLARAVEERRQEDGHHGRPGRYRRGGGTCRRSGAARRAD